MNVKNANDHLANIANAGGITISPLTAAATLPRGWKSTSIAECEFLSLPRPRERCPFCDLSRTTLCELLNRGVIQGVTIRRPGATRGKRLIVKSSLAKYLYSLVSETASQQPTNNT
jgi:hypothetical protein